jgi:CubicO group peptidase (beta-lactamase class C family)
MKKILPLLALLLLFACNPAEKSDSEKIISQFLQTVENDLKDDNIQGSTSLVILKGNDILASGAFGFISPEKNNLVNQNTIYRIGSITKSFTGFLLLKLNQDKVLSLDDPIEKYLPEIKTLVDYNSHPSISFRQLASHTSGLDRESRNRGVNMGAVEEWQKKVLAAIPDTRFLFPPNERFRYSNIGYAILGLAISRAASKPFIELVNDEILKPLEMTNTYFEIPETKQQNLAKGIAGGPTAELDYELPQREHIGRGYRVPNGGLYSSPEDMAKFIKACMGYANALNENSLELLQTSQTPTTRLRSNYSFGFDLYSDQGIQTVGHRGSTPGYSAHFEFEKNSQYAIVIMRNYNFGNTNLDLRSNALLRKLALTK